MCFGGGDDSSEELIKMQKQEAAEARAKEVARQARIQQGLSAIRDAFQGKAIMRDVNKAYDWSQFQAPTGAVASNQRAAGSAVSGLPAGYTYVQVPGETSAVAPKAAATGGGGYTREARPTTGGNAGQQRTVIGGDHGAQGGGLAQRTNPNQAAVTAAAATPGATWGIRGPDGRIYRRGEGLGFKVTEDTGKRAAGGFDDKFYNNFKQGILDAYMPQVQEQFGKAANETLFRHARAGTLESSGQIGTAADLTKQNLLQEGNVQLKADTATADLKNRVAKEQAALENQLYATENPDVAANATLAAVENINAVKPDTTPLGEIFQIAAIGGANLLKGAANARNRLGGYGSGGYGATTIVPR